MMCNGNTSAKGDKLSKQFGTKLKVLRFWKRLSEDVRNVGRGVAVGQCDDTLFNKLADEMEADAHMTHGCGASICNANARLVVTVEQCRWQCIIPANHLGE